MGEMTIRNIDDALMVELSKRATLRGIHVEVLAAELLRKGLAFAMVTVPRAREPSRLRNPIPRRSTRSTSSERTSSVMSVIVSDASVAVKWYVHEANRDEALRWLDDVDNVFIAPDVFLPEVVNALRKQNRAGYLTDDLLDRR